MSPLITWSLRARLALALVLGVLAALGLAPFGFWPVTIVALAVIPFLLGAAASRGQAGWTGWAFGLGYFALALAWIVEPFLVDSALFGWMAPFALVFMAGGLSLFWAAAFWASAALARTLGLRIVTLVVTWTLAEFARAYVLTGFPWAAPGQIWIETNAALLLAWVGPEGLNLLTFLGALPLGLILIPASGQAARLTGLVPALTLIAILAINGVAPEQVAMTGKTVRLVQPNAPQRQKWDPAFVPVFFQRMIDATAAGDRPDLVVWPEASLGGYIPGQPDPRAAIAEAAGGVPVVVGLVRPDVEGYFNSLVLLDGTGDVTAVYDKHHLVPFGEYLPFEGLLNRFGLEAMAKVLPGGMVSGPGPELMDFGALGIGLPLICYEAVFARDILEAPGRADFLLQITNDAWFGTWSGPYQHLAQARMRAIEQGLPMIRVANTGISAMVDPYGRIIASLPLGEAGYIDVPLPRPLAATFYARIGDLPVLMLVLGLLAMLLASRAFQNLSRISSKQD